MIAHLLTALRFALALPLAAAFAHPELLDRGPLAVYLAVALATDYFDGVVARRYGTASAGGQLFDHATDCFFVTTCLTGAALGGHVPLLLPVLIAVAFLQYAIDSYLLHRERQLRMSALGRWNGVLYFVPVGGVILADLGLAWLAPLMPAVAWLLVASTLASIADRLFELGRRRPTAPD